MHLWFYYAQPRKLVFTPILLQVQTVCPNVLILPTKVVGKSCSKRPIVPSGVSKCTNTLNHRSWYVFTPNVLQVQTLGPNVLFLSTIYPIVPSGASLSKIRNTTDKGSQYVFTLNILHVQMLCSNVHILPTAVVGMSYSKPLIIPSGMSDCPYSSNNSS